MFLGYVYNMFFLEKLWNPQEWENILEPGKKATSMREASKIQFAGELTSLRCGKPEASTVMGMAQAIVYLFWPAKSVIFSNEPQYLIWGHFFHPYIAIPKFAECAIMYNQTCGAPSRLDLPFESHFSRRSPQSPVMDRHTTIFCRNTLTPVYPRVFPNKAVVKISPKNLCGHVYIYIYTYIYIYIYIYTL